MELFTNNDWEDFKNGILAVNCKTELDAGIFFDLLIQNGIKKWSDCSEIDTEFDSKQTCWFDYKLNTCYMIEEGNLYYAAHNQISEDDSIQKVLEFRRKNYNNGCVVLTHTVGIKESKLPTGNLTTGAMIDMLLNNPKLKAKIVNENDTDILMINAHSDFVWEHNQTIAKFKPFYKDRLWYIIEPVKQLMKMSFAEAMKYYIARKRIVSLHTNESYYRDAYDSIDSVDSKEIDGLWTVEGIYEEDTN